MPAGDSVGILLLCVRSKLVFDYFTLREEAACVFTGCNAYMGFTPVILSGVTGDW